MSATPDGYRLGKHVHSGKHSTILEAVRVSDGREVVLKGYLRDRANDAAPRARRELEILRRVAGPGVPEALELDCTTEQPFLVLERVPGSSLTQHLHGGPFDVGVWLALAVQMADTLTRIHAAHVLHKDLGPHNLLVDRARTRVWICDFGLSVELGTAERRDDGFVLSTEGLLQYFSPEQTGRMNRGCDRRSDLYSLGATLYHALTGHPPFQSSDPLELVHAHLARVPRSPLELRPDLPGALSRIVLRLLLKEPDDRYQTALALHADLLACQQALARSGTIDDRVELGSAEQPDAPRFAPRLYGREAETTLLHEAYRDVVQGRPRTLWIQGSPGAGKSTLVNELRPLLAETQGYLAIAKFDAYADRPYAGWISALSSLAQQLLIESDVRLERWRREILDALGPVASALVDLVPDLTFIVGQLPAARRLEPHEAQARLSLALSRFITACATTDHPLVVLLDDLQWSDPASRGLLAEVLASPPPALLLIGAYPEGDDDPALRALEERLAVKPRRLRLGAVSREAATAMLTDALQRPTSEVSPLAEIIERRTGNVPLVIRHFVEHIHARGFLRYELGTGWQWNAAEISSTDLPQSAAGLVSRKLNDLSEESRELLQIASCIGHEFDLDLLCAVARRDRLATWEALQAATDAGLVVPCASGFRFAHDHIRECAQQQISDAERARIHGGIARLLLERTSADDPASYAVTIVEHLNRVRHVPEDLRIRAIQLNYTAGAHSLSVGAAASAVANFAVARKLLRDTDRVEHAALALDISLHSAESAFQTRDLAAALSFLDEIDPGRLSTLEQARVESKRLQILATSADPVLCAGHALRALRAFGVRLPMHPSRLRAQLALLLIDARLRLRKSSELLHPAKKLHEKALAVLLLLRPSSASLARVDVNLAVLATCTSVRQFIRHGFFASPGYGLAVYSTYLYLYLENRARAQTLAEAALVWSERVVDSSSPRARMMVEVVLYPFLMPRRRALAGIDRIIEASRENGDPEFAHYARFSQICYLALGGSSVAETAKRFTRIADDVRDSKQWYTEAERCRRAYALLDEDAMSPAEIERVYRSDLNEPTMPSAGQAISGTLWLLVLCTFGRYDLVFSHSESLWSTLFKLSPFVHVVDHVFYRGLAAAVLMDSAGGRARHTYARALRDSLRYLGRRARDGPDFVHMHTLLQAEQARLSRTLVRSAALYEEAATKASKQAFPHHAALAHERHASLLTTARRETEAASLLKKAVASYREWGASGKARLLSAQRRGLVPGG